MNHPASPHDFLELHAFLRLHPVPEGVLDQRHLGHQIGGFDEFRLGVAARKADVGHRGFFGQKEIHHLVDIKVVIAQGDVDLVQEDEFDPGIEDLFLCDAPAVLGRRDVAVAVLGFPCKPSPDTKKRTSSENLSRRKVFSPVSQLPLMNWTTAEGMP